MMAENIHYFENNYENLIYTTKSTDWSHNFEPKFQKGEKHRFFSLYYRMKINLRQKIQKLCSNQFVRPTYLDKNLKCLFAHHENPFLKANNQVLWLHIVMILISTIVVSISAFFVFRAYSDPDDDSIQEE